MLSPAMSRFVAAVSCFSVLLVLSPLAKGQNTCQAVPVALPCLDQPHEGDTQITGRATAPGATITISINGAAAQPAVVRADGTFILTSVPALNRFNSIVASQTAPAATTGPVTVLIAPGAATDVPTLFTLGLFGINATGSSSSGPSQQYFAELDLLAPLRWLPKVCESATSEVLDRRCWVWLNPRIASVPTATSAAISSITSSSLTTNFGNQTLGQITQSFEFQAGAEYYLVKPSKAPFWGLGKSWAKSAVSIIFGGGIVTPFNSITAAPEYGLNSNLAQQFNQIATLPGIYPQLALGLCGYGFTGSTGVTCPNPLPTTKPTTVAFVFPNRSRFYRAVYAGFRLRFFYFNGSCSGTSVVTGCDQQNTYPGTFDLRFGEDESVTGGHFVPLVVTATGSFPIPGTKGALRVFGSSYLRAFGNRNTTALVLIPSANFTSLDNSSVVVQQIERSDQDYFRLGIGLDIFPLLGKLKP